MFDMYLWLMTASSLAIAFLLYKTNFFPRVNWNSSGMNQTISGRRAVIVNSQESSIAEGVGVNSVNVMNNMTPSVFMFFVVLGCAALGYYFCRYYVFGLLPGYAEVGATTFFLMGIVLISWVYIFSRLALSIMILGIFLFLSYFGLILIALGLSFVTGSDYASKIRNFKFETSSHASHKERMASDKIKRRNYHLCFFDSSIKNRGQYHIAYNDCIRNTNHYDKYVAEHGENGKHSNYFINK